jgi:hypothetical protein
MKYNLSKEFNVIQIPLEKYFVFVFVRFIHRVCKIMPNRMTVSVRPSLCFISSSVTLKFLKNLGRILCNFVTRNSLRGGAVSTKSNPQSGGPVDYT